MLAAPLSLRTLAWLSATGLWPEYSLHFNCFLFSLIFSDVTVIVAKEGIEPSFCGYEPHILAVRWPCNKPSDGTRTHNHMIPNHAIYQLKYARKNILKLFFLGSVLNCPYPFHIFLPSFLKVYRSGYTLKHTRGGTWTRNLLIKSQLLCQLSHTDAVVCLTTLLHPMGLEPTSYWLKVSHSTIKLQVLIFLSFGERFRFIFFILIISFISFFTTPAGFEPAITW